MSSSESLRPAPGGRKPLGKLAARLEELKSPWRQVSSLELSHNEAARLATDALLEHGEREYRRVLTEERELSFLSQAEIRYIAQHRDPDNNGSAVTGSGSGSAAGSGPAADEPQHGDAAESDVADDVASEVTSGTYFPTMTDDEPPVLELGWPDAPLRYGPSETQIYFQRDKTVNVKDRIRSLINKAKKVIALVMDEFSDVDLLCDLMEASSKRKVPVYILLDHKNLQLFTDMCSSLDVHSVNMSNMRIRSVCGDTYCAKSGRKFSGQVLEKFLIIDCEEVIAGSYSFTWLSAQVHSNMMMHFSGRITESFDREFRCLYADSQIIECFYNDEDEALPNFPPYQAPLMPTGFTPVIKANLLSDRQRSGSDNSSSQSGSSLSSVKAAPGLTSNPVYKVTQGHDKGDLLGPHQFSLERCGAERRTQNLAPPRPSSNHSPLLERRTPTYGLERAKGNPADVIWSHRVGPTSKFQALGLYEHKMNLFHATTPPPRIHRSRTPPLVIPETKLGIKHRSSSNQLLHKLSDCFLPPSGKDHLARSASPHGTIAGGGPDLSRGEPESQQAPPPPPPLAQIGKQDQTVNQDKSTRAEHTAEQDQTVRQDQITRQDQKRMTLGHSKLDLVNQYNKMKSKQVYSRFELKNSQ
ncbi:protein FAM83C [Syngnathoides biaculeatus]|uniref:protein FAM83C n=1 Tax=Syngnathoides biaculeatus TaxID=300417 RepID=UPI002ADE1453|nr:protein FAM83C [Syngnathoides biaculeatus]